MYNEEWDEIAELQSDSEEKNDDYIAFLNLVIYLTLSLSICPPVIVLTVRT